MFSKLPDLFNKNFAIGYFLPTIIFLLANRFLLEHFKLSLQLLNFSDKNQVDALVGTTLIGLISWLLSILLMALNRDMIRFLEGYGKLNPLKLFGFIERNRYLKLKAKIEELDRTRLTCISQKTEFPPKLRSQRIRLMQKIVMRFPDDERWLLPTSFGNTIRAFEVYSRIMYGIDSIPGWYRLLGVVPDNFRKFIEEAEAQVNFWINICLLSSIIITEFIGLSIFFGKFSFSWIPAIAIIITVIAYTKARNASVEWGNWVKSSFDIYLSDLRKKLNFPDSTNVSEEKRLWSKLSRAIIYNKTEDMPIGSGNFPAKKGENDNEG